MQKIKLFFSFILVFTSIISVAQHVEYKEIKDVPYYSSSSDAYINDRCKVDVYYPTNKKSKATVVWFHGGGLTGGAKELPIYLKNKELTIIGVGYRLSPKVKVAEIIEDAAQAIAWTFQNVEKYGGSKDKIILSGHSAGGYLVTMVGLNPAYLQKHQLSNQDILGVVPFSGQAITHFTARKEQGFTELQPTVDSLAPLFWVNKNSAPFLFITGDRELEMVGRYEENAYLVRMLKLLGQQNAKLLELAGYGHDMAYPAFPLLINEVNRLIDQAKK